MLLTEVETCAEKYFHMERPRLAAEFSFEFEEDNRSGPDTDRKDTSVTYSEKLDIETSGWMYHPALAIYSLVLTPEWEQISERSDDSDIERTNTFLQGYDAEFTFLQYKPYTLTLRGSKYMTTYNSSFAEKSKSETDTYGATLDLKYKVLPSSLDYLHSESDQTGFFSTRTERDQVRFRTRYKKMGGDTSIDASYLNNEQTTGTAVITTTTKNARLRNSNNLLNFPGAKLDSLFALRDLKTDFSERKVLTWSENLRVKHRENLSTSYTMRTEGTRTGESEKSQSQNIGFGLSHTLYENLTTGFNVNGGKSTSASRAEDRYGAGLNWNYIRKIPWGRINVNIGHKYRVADIRVESDLAEVNDESVALTDPQGTFLANDHIDDASIVVTDSSQVPYIKDIDYSISSVNFLTRITRIPTGSIPPGATVLVDYEYQPDPAFDYSLFDQKYGVILDLWKAWRVYYNFNRSTQNFLRGIEPDTLSRNLSHNAGTELKWKWSRTKVDYTDRRSTELSLVRWNSSETISIKPAKRIFLSFSGNYGETKFKDSGDKETFNGVSTNVQIITSRRTRLRLNGFRNEISGSAIDTVSSGLSSVFEWFYGIYNGNIVYRFTEEKDNMSAEKFRNHLIAFVIKRELF